MSASTAAPSITDRFRDQNILLTGATGFLAKAILEKIVRAIPEVGRLYLLVRPGRTAGVDERLEREVIGSTIFDYLRHTEGARFMQRVREKIVAIEGDLSLDRLGLSEASYGELAGNVTCIVNSAAACSFGEQLDHALQVNTLGPARVLRLAKDAGNVPLLHISTCYVNGTRAGDIPEQVLPPGHTVNTFVNDLAPVYDLDRAVSSMLNECTAIRASVVGGDRDDEVLGDAYRPLLPSDRVDTMRQVFADRAIVDLGKRMAQLHGWTDTYPFTKALGEQLLVRERGSVPLSLLRPSIIESSYEEPVPGWIDGMRMADPVITEVGRGNLPEFVGRAGTTLDLIPCDMVVNASLAAVPPAGATDHCKVYQIGSSAQNPLSLERLAQGVAEGFARWPARDREGRRLTPNSCKWVSVPEFKRKLYRQIRQARLMRDLDTRIGLKERARRANQKLRVFERCRVLADLYSFYTTHSPRFSNTNVQALYDAMTPTDRERFPFDVTKIDWWEYIVERHIPGLQRMASPKNGVRQAVQREALEHIGDARCLYDLFERTVTAYGDRIATQARRRNDNGWVRYSFRQMTDAAAHVHAQLTSRGLQSGDRILVYGDSGPEWGVAFWGLQRAGLIAVPVDPDKPPPEVAEIARRTDARAILVGPRRHQELAAHAVTIPILALAEPLIPRPEQLPTREGSTAPPKRAVQPQDPASMVLSNGTGDGLQTTPLTHTSVLADIRAVLQVDERSSEPVLIAMPCMHDPEQFARGFVSTLAIGACVTYVDGPGA
jgi:fatty acyl-CoA reductase